MPESSIIEIFKLLLNNEDENLDLYFKSAI